MTRKILHLDLDAFYPSVEVLDNPELAGKPIIVGGLGDRGVVASASYEARQYDVHSALPMALARRRCPDGVYLRPRFDRYRSLSRRVFDIYRRWTELVEPLSLDEAYLDVSSSLESGVEIARSIKVEVRRDTGLTVSAGVAHNKFLAKLASDLEKPDGLTHIPQPGARSFLANMPVRRLWGVGPATATRLAEAGFETIGNVAAVSDEQLRKLLGKHGQRIGEFARGQDSRRVTPPGRPKSISAEVTVDRDLRSWAEAAPYVRRFAERIEASLTRHDIWARTVTLKVRYPDFRTITRSHTPGSPVRDREQILEIAHTLARRVELRASERLRLIGLGVSNLGRRADLVEEMDPQRPQLDLFADDDPPGC